MTSKSQWQDRHPNSFDWPRRLFRQASGNRQKVFQANPVRIAVKPVLETRKSACWSTRLFESSALDPRPGDKLTTFLDHRSLSELYFNTDPAEIYIGSDPVADVRLDAPNVSRFHARITRHHHRYQLTDTGSQQGTYLNGKKIPPYQAVDLNHGASIRIMAYQFKFEQCTKIHGGPKAADPPGPTEQSNLPTPDLLPAVASTLTDAHFVLPEAWPSGILDLSVADIIDETDAVKTFRLKGVTPLSFSYLPGQFVTLLLEIDGLRVQRSYSMSSSPSRPCTLDLTVKRVPGGLVSNWLCDHLRPGDRLSVKGPAGRFSCLRRPADQYLFIGAGSGIVPLMSMLRWLSDTASHLPVTVLFSFRNYDDVIFARELELLNAVSQSIDIAITLTGQPAGGGPLCRYSGRIDRAILERFIPDILQTEAFLCGPDPFMVQVKSILKDLNFPGNRIHCESYDQKKSKLHPPALNSTSSPNESVELALPPLTDVGPVHTVTFAKSNKIVQVNEQTSLLELAESHGIHIDNDCKTGNCGECMVKSISGQTAMDEECDIDDREREQGWLFSCCSYARSDLVINA